MFFLRKYPPVVFFLFFFFFFFAHRNTIGANIRSMTVRPDHASTSDPGEIAPTVFPLVSFDAIDSHEMSHVARQRMANTE